MKKIILCPNPNRDRGMETTRRADAILRQMGFQTVVCPPFKDQKDGAYGDYKTRPLTAELKSADLLITFGGDGTILHLAKLVALNKIPVLGINMGGLGFIAELEAGELEALRKLKDWDFQTEQRMMLDVTVLREGKPVEPKVFQYQIAYNVIPQIGGEAFEGYTSEEMKMQNEGRKIMHLPDLKVSCTCVRVPVVRSHSISVSLHFDRPISVQEARETIAKAPGCRLVDDLAKKEYPMPLDTSNQDIVFVGRIRPDLTDPNGLCLWCCGDQVRKGAATNAVQIAELLVK